MVNFRENRPCKKSEITSSVANPLVRKKPRTALSLSDFLLGRISYGQNPDFWDQNVTFLSTPRPTSSSSATYWGDFEPRPLPDLRNPKPPFSRFSSENTPKIRKNRRFFGFGSKIVIQKGRLSQKSSFLTNPSSVRLSTHHFWGQKAQAGHFTTFVSNLASGFSKAPKPSNFGDFGENREIGRFPNRKFYTNREDRPFLEVLSLVQKGTKNRRFRKTRKSLKSPILKVKFNILAKSWGPKITVPFHERFWPHFWHQNVKNHHFRPPFDHFWIGRDPARPFS